MTWEKRIKEGKNKEKTGVFIAMRVMYKCKCAC